MPRKLDPWELTALDTALKERTSADQINQTYGADAVSKATAETGIRLPGADASALSEAERNLYISTLTKGQDLWSTITNAGISSTAALQRLNETQLYVPLTQDHEQIYNWASENKISAAQLSELSGTPQEAIDTVLAGAGLSLPGGTKKGSQTGITGSDPNYPGGLPRQQLDGGGMYGFATPAETPRNVLGQIPQLPSLRQVRKTAKRQNDPNWKGTTDTILTSGRGITDSANVAVKTLLGA